MIILDKNFHFTPLVDLTAESTCYQDEIPKAIHEFIMENQNDTFVNGERVKVFHMSGFAKKHHYGLVDYLNKKLFQKRVARIVEGQFAGFPLQHYWVSIDNIIIDLTVKQFINKSFTTSEALRKLIDCHAFVSDNIDNYIYKLYR